nr:ribonuclease H-like domain-containing protein [Tanacetum cinerariifolium]
MADAKEIWEVIKSRFGDNDESNKMQKYLLKQQFEGFSVSTSEGLHKGYDRFQSLLSQLEIHGASVSHEDANQKFLRSLPSSWSQVALIMRTKLGLDTLSFDDLYNNLRVFEHDVKGTIASSQNIQNIGFMSTNNTSSTNDRLWLEKGREKQRQTLLMALPEDHLEKFHKMADAKEMWEVIKSRFGDNDESNKMQKYLLKQQFEGFSVSTLEGLHKGYDRFQTLLSQLEIHGASVSHEDANQKFLRSLPSSWSQVALIMRTKPGLDTLSFDDLYNNLRINDDDMEEIDLKWKVAMISMRIKKFHKRTRRKLQFDTKDPVGFDKSKVECFNCHKIGHFARDCKAKGNQDRSRRDAGYNGNKTRDNGRRPAYQDDLKSLLTIAGEDIDCSGHVEEDAQNYAMMAYSSSKVLTM